MESKVYEGRGVSQTYRRDYSMRNTHFLKGQPQLIMFVCMWPSHSWCEFRARERALCLRTNHKDINIILEIKSGLYVQPMCVVVGWKHGVGQFNDWLSIVSKVLVQVCYFGVFQLICVSWPQIQKSQNILFERNSWDKLPTWKKLQEKGANVYLRPWMHHHEYRLIMLKLFPAGHRSWCCQNATSKKAKLMLMLISNRIQPPSAGEHGLVGWMDLISVVKVASWVAPAEHKRRSSSIRT